jgi:CubicO group peptidase (beta-lactamase class C family)
MAVDEAAERSAASLACWALSLILLGCCVALWSCGKDPAEQSAAVDALFLNGEPGAAPGAAVIVIRNGEVLKRAGYGMADLERGAPIGSNTAFRLASVSKQFTAMAIMLLEEEGRLAYDDPITRFLPELARFGDAITIRHLLTHTSGLPDYYDVMVQVSGVERPLTKHALDVFEKWGEPLFAPGERYEYSNPGYELLALIAERASGQSFPEFVAERIFEPLGMTHSLVVDERALDIPKRALGYRRNGEAFEEYDDDPLNYIFGSGGIYSTVEDLYQWDRALYTEKLVSAETLKQAFTPVRFDDGEKYGYGFGWRLGEHMGRRRVAHAGGWVGFSTFIARYVNDRFSVIVLTNLEDADAEALANAIAGIYLAGDAEAGKVSDDDEGGAGGGE